MRREGKKIVLTTPEAVEQEGSVEDTEREHVDGRKLLVTVARIHTSLGRVASSPVATC